MAETVLHRPGIHAVGNPLGSGRVAKTVERQAIESDTFDRRCEHPIAEVASPQWTAERRRRTAAHRQRCTTAGYKRPARRAKGPARPASGCRPWSLASRSPAPVDVDDVASDGDGPLGEVDISDPARQCLTEALAEDANCLMRKSPARVPHRLAAMHESNRRMVREVFEACRSLSASTGRPFSPDGHLVGSLGEVLAADLLNLTLMPPSNEGYDAVDSDGRKVEIKTTTRRSISLSASGTCAERLVVVVLDRDGNPSIVYDDGCDVAWDAAGKPQKNGQRSISLSRLDQLQPRPRQSE